MVSCPSPEGSVVFRTVVRNAFSHGALALRTLTKRWGFTFWGPGSTALSPSN